MPTVKFPYTTTGRRKAQQAASEYGGNVEQYDGDVYRTQGGGGPVGITGATSNYNVPSSTYQEVPDYSQPADITNPIVAQQTQTGGQSQYGGYGGGGVDVGLPPQWMYGEGAAPWSSNYLDYIAPTQGGEPVNWNEPLEGVYQHMFPAGDYSPSDWDDWITTGNMFGAVSGSNLQSEWEGGDVADYGDWWAYNDWWASQNNPILFEANQWEYPTLTIDYQNEMGANLPGQFANFNPELLMMLTQGWENINIGDEGIDYNQPFDPSAEPAFWSFLSNQMGGAEWGWGPGQYNWSNMWTSPVGGDPTGAGGEGWFNNLLILMGVDNYGWDWDTNQSQQFMGHDIWMEQGQYPTPYDDMMPSGYGQDIVPKTVPITPDTPAVPGGNPAFRNMQGVRESYNPSLGNVPRYPAPTPGHDIGPPNPNQPWMTRRKKSQF